ncbi:hypothetical protein [Desulfatirhabdium butyrativorans]|uniref:hypothetical protein n=1 Tax=Desulfatirhabdium butyrativorans TaxID=340467 RepID=UPI000409F192|nr:hypothetical protein [Desulfatirhabdium butyrativorans]
MASIAPQFEQLLNHLKARVPEYVHPLLDLSAAAHFLLNPPDPNDNPAGRWFLEALSANLLPDAIRDDRSAAWRLTTVIVVDADRRARITTFMVGALTHSAPAIFPEWAASVLDDATRSAIRDAFQAASSLTDSDRSFFCFPLLPPNGPGRIERRSIGLPIALTALSALTGKPMADSMIATGDIDPANSPFSVRPVADIPAKADVACRSGFRLLLIPAKGESALQRDGISIKPVNDLEQAWLWARFYAPGWEIELDLLYHTQNEPGLLVDRSRMRHTVKSFGSRRSCW